MRKFFKSLVFMTTATTFMLGTAHVVSAKPALRATQTRGCEVSTFTIPSTNDANTLRITTRLCDGREPCMDYDVIRIDRTVVRISTTCLTAPVRRR